jgi:hypothetical protein
MPPVANTIAFARKTRKRPALTIVTERTDYSSVLFQQNENGAFHVHIDPLMHTVILQRSNHFQARAITDMCEPRIFVTAKIALENASIFRAIEDCAPSFELAHPVWRFLRVQLGHPPIIDVLAAAHGIGEMHFPTVTVIDVG